MLTLLLVTSSTGKTLHAPDHGLVMFNDEQFKKGVVEAVMPLLTSNTHPHELAGLGVTLAEMEHFGSDYAKQVIANSKALGKALSEEGVKVLYKELDYSESHTLLIEHPQAEGMVTLLDRAGILTNACQLPWDKQGSTTGLRIGTQVLTRKGYTQEKMAEVANIISQILIHKKQPEVIHFKQVKPLARKHKSIAYSFDKEFSLTEDLFKSNLIEEVKNTFSILRSSPVFSNCSIKEISSIKSYFELIKLEKNKEIFTIDSPSDSMYFIGSGIVEIIDKMYCTDDTVQLVKN